MGTLAGATAFFPSAIVWPVSPGRFFAHRVPILSATMLTLLTNDDGIFAPGLAALERALRRLGDVSVVAPSTEQSGVGHAITFLTPLTAKEVFDGPRSRGWAVDGSPADAVKLGISEFCPRRPDLVVSGINSGLNAGINVLYSGTVAAAIEGAFFGLYNINIPTRALRGTPELRVVPMSIARYGEAFERRVDPRGRAYYWATNDPPPPPSPHESDVTALAAGKVTLTPLDYDLTHRARLAALAEGPWQITPVAE